MLEPEHWFDMALAYWDAYERHDDRWLFRRRRTRSWYRQEIAGRVTAQIEADGPSRGGRMPEAFPTFEAYWSRTSWKVPPSA